LPRQLVGSCDLSRRVDTVIEVRDAHATDRLAVKIVVFAGGAQRSAAPTLLSI
jgi:hypothetical protein